MNCNNSRTILGISIPNDVGKLVLDTYKLLGLSESAGKPPHNFQILCSYLLASQAGCSVCLTQSTGMGKSMIIPSTALLLGGVVLVLEPLLAVGADQGHSMSRLLLESDVDIEEVSCIHLDDFNQGSKYHQDIIEVLNNIKNGEKHTMILYVSINTMTSDHFLKALDDLMDRGCLSTVVIDEVHKFVTEPCYCKEFLELKYNLFKKLSQRKNISLLVMSATFPKDLRQEFSKLYDVSFDYKILGAISRQDISLKCSFVNHSQVRNVLFMPSFKLVFLSVL